jgi:hypothetical protein
MLRQCAATGVPCAGSVHPVVLARPARGRLGVVSYPAPCRRVKKSTPGSRVIKIASLAEANAAERDLARIVKSWCDWREGIGAPGEEAKSTAGPKAGAESGEKTKAKAAKKTGALGRR